MERTTYSFEHHPLEYMPAINTICGAFNIQYKIFDLADGKYKADLLYNNIRYTGPIHNTIEITLESLVNEIRYILSHNIELNINPNVLEGLEYIINSIKNYRHATTKG